LVFWIRIKQFFAAYLPILIFVSSSYISEEPLFEDCYPITPATRGQFHQHSMRSFYVRKFCAQLFLCLLFSFVLYWCKTVGAKAVHRTLLKLNPGVNFAIILRAAFAPIFFSTKKYKPKM
jgi:hypothetical protein